MKPIARLFLLIGALLGASGVALGAYASHGLKNWASTAQIEFFQLAVTYQLFHAIALVAVSILALFFCNRWLIASQISFVFGVIFFSASLYFYVFTGIKLLGAITPFGGLLLIIAWLLFAISIFRKSVKC